MNVVVYEDPESGNLVVLVPVSEPAELQLRFVPPGATPSIIDHTKLPQTKEFRKAWSVDESGETVVVSLEKAKEVTKERLRQERAALLDELDVAVLRAIENAQPFDDLIAEKQRLRDITKLADSASTLDELRALRAELKK